MPLGLAMRRTLAASAAAAALLFGALTLQMARGQDPAVGTSASPGGQDTTQTTASTASTVPADDGVDLDEGGAYVAPQQVPAPAPVQTSTS